MLHHIFSLPRQGSTPTLEPGLLVPPWKSRWTTSIMRHSENRVIHRCLGTFIWVFPKIGVPQIIHFNRVFHYKVYPFWGASIFGNTHIGSYRCSHLHPYKCIQQLDLYTAQRPLLIEWKHQNLLD